MPDVSRVWSHPGDRKPRRQIVTAVALDRWAGFLLLLRFWTRDCSPGVRNCERRAKWRVVISPRSDTAINISQR